MRNGATQCNGATRRSARGTNKKTLQGQGFCADSAEKQTRRVMGVEPTTFSLGSCKPTQENTTNAANYELAQASVAQSDTTTTPKTAAALRSDPALAALVAAWPDLPEAVRVGILAMVTATGCQSPKERG